jgi:long-subunit acyl-CoA synthetase (AMP-forming)
MGPKGITQKVFGKGEILVKNFNHFLGYIGLEEEDTKKVLDDDGWYHTGDFGFFDDQNRLYVCCRVADLLEIGGEKVRQKLNQNSVF